MRRIKKFSSPKKRDGSFFFWISAFAGIAMCAPFVDLQGRQPAAVPPPSSPSSSIVGVEESSEFSPLFFERKSLSRTRTSDEHLHTTWKNIAGRAAAVQPKRDSFSYAFRWVTKDIDKTIEKVARRFVVTENKPYSYMTLEPIDFALREGKRIDGEEEITVTLALRNASNRQIRMTFPTSQRLEVFTKNQSGTVIEKWSESRNFDFLEEIVVVNPNETIEYSQQISTRGMKSGETYLIEASFFNNPQYTKTAIIRPR